MSEPSTRIVRSVEEEALPLPEPLPPQPEMANENAKQAIRAADILDIGKAPWASESLIVIEYLWEPQVSLIFWRCLLIFREDVVSQSLTKCWRNSHKHDVVPQLHARCSWGWFSRESRLRPTTGLSPFCPARRCPVFHQKMVYPNSSQGMGSAAGNRRSAGGEVAADEQVFGNCEEPAAGCDIDSVGQF